VSCRDICSWKTTEYAEIPAAIIHGECRNLCWWKFTEYAGISAQENLPSMQRSLLKKAPELVQISAAEILSACVDLCHWKSLSLQRYLMLKIHQRYSYLSKNQERCRVLLLGIQSACRDFCW
jgi:hypothetical protein